MAREVYVDTAECTGCEYCVDSLPEVFRMTPEGTSEVHDPEGAGSGKIQQVIDNCPAECIHWR
ncbi:MAG: ferredoxin [Spirochaetes bacterium]|nr:ferredoxin [Spirochaetota bacterium]